MSTQPNYDALAKQAGAVDTDSPQPQQQPNGSVDYDALAKQAGAIDIPQDQDDSGVSRDRDGSFVITPREGESFADTIKRAAQAGKNVTQEQIQSQTKRGLKEAPAVLAAAPVVGAAGSAALAGAGETLAELPGLGKAVLSHLESRAAEYASQYPHLIALAKSFGVPTTVASMLYYLHSHEKGKSK